MEAVAAIRWYSSIQEQCDATTEARPTCQNAGDCPTPQPRTVAILHCHLLQSYGRLATYRLVVWSHTRTSPLHLTLGS